MKCAPISVMESGCDARSVARSTDELWRCILNVEEATAVLSYSAKRVADAVRAMEECGSSCPLPELRNEQAFFGRVLELAEQYLDLCDQDLATPDQLLELGFVPSGKNDGCHVLRLDDCRDIWSYPDGSIVVMYDVCNEIQLSIGPMQLGKLRHLIAALSSPKWQQYVAEHQP